MLGEKMFHFHWLRAWEIGVMKADLVKVVKNARKVLRVMLMGSFGKALPSLAARTAIMTGQVGHGGIISRYRSSEIEVRTHQ